MSVCIEIGDCVYLCVCDGCVNAVMIVMECVNRFLSVFVCVCVRDEVCE